MYTVASVLHVPDLGNDGGGLRPDRRRARVLEQRDLPRELRPRHDDTLLRTAVHGGDEAAPRRP